MSQITKRLLSRWLRVLLVAVSCSLAVIVWLIKAREVHSFAFVRRRILKGKELFNWCKEKHLFHQMNNEVFIIHFLCIFPASALFLINPVKKEIINWDF